MKVRKGKKFEIWVEEKDRGILMMMKLGDQKHRHNFIFLTYNGLVVLGVFHSKSLCSGIASYYHSATVPVSFKPPCDLNSTWSILCKTKSQLMRWSRATDYDDWLSNLIFICGLLHRQIIILAESVIHILFGSSKISFRSNGFWCHFLILHSSVSFECVHSWQLCKEIHNFNSQMGVKVC